MKAGNKAVGHPINVATGEMYLTTTDVQVPGRIPLEWERRYSTDTLQNTPEALGPGWSVPYFSNIQVTAGGIDLVTPDGNQARFDDPDNLLAIGQKIINYGTFQELEKIGPEYRLTQWDVDTGAVERFCYGALPGTGTTFRLIRIENITGQAVDLEWNVQGQLLCVRQRIEGRSLQFSYLPNGLLDTLFLHGAGGEKRLVVQYRYDAFGRLVTATDTTGRTQEYDYDDQSRMIEEVQKGGGIYTFQYDAQGRCVHTTGLDNYDAKSLSYVDSVGVTYVTDSRGAVTQYQWLLSGQIVQEIDALGGRKETQYDDHDRIVKLTGPDDGVTTFEYDDRGNRSTIIDPSGTATRIRYNDNHQVVMLTDPGGQRWFRSYDEYSNWVCATDPQGIQWRFTYDRNSQLTAIINPNGAHRQFLYDAQGNQIANTDWMGRRTEYHHDPFGYLTGQTDVDGKTTTLTRDPHDRITAIRTRDGSQLRYAYDDGDNLSAIIDQAGRTTRFRYGFCGRLVEEIDALGQRVRYVWDNEPDLLKKIINEKEEVYLFEHDEVGRVKKRITFDGRVIEHEYDPTGKLLAEYRNGDPAVRFEYDAAGRPVKRQTAEETALFQYDAYGQLVSAVNETIAIEIERDYKGRVITERQGKHVLNYTYDLLGRRISLVSSLGHHVDYEYNANGDLLRIGTGNGDTIKFDLDELGRETKRRLPGGLELLQQYNARGQLTLQSLGPANGFQPDGPVPGPAASPIVKREYKYDISGLLTALSDNHWGTQTYTYDPLDRLISTRTDNASENFAYDPTGNLLSAQRTGRPTQHMRYDQGNRLESQGEFHFTFDEQGRQVKKTRTLQGEPDLEWCYKWNDSDQMTSVVTPNGERWIYTYDPLGRRIGKTGPDCNIEFVWDGYDVIHEKQDQKVRTWIHDVYDFKLLAQIEEDCFYSVITDQIGTPRELMDHSGRIAWQSNRWVWGERRESSHEWAVDCPWNFPGQYSDEESGLYYNCFRYFDPYTGRYISPDPIGILGGFNEYGYSRNPVNWIDPLGLDGCNQDILMVGEGNLSYARSLVEAGEIDPIRLTATVYEPELSTGAIENAAYLKEKGATIMTGVDAKDLSSKFGGRKFNQIHFHFPHTGSRDLGDNRALLRDFMKSAKGQLTNNGQIKVTLSKNPYYNGFAIKQAGESAGLERVDMQDFSIEDYPNYKHVRTTDSEKSAETAEEGKIHIWERKE